MRKGQEEAPVELLIGVTIMTFVIILGFYTYQNACSSQYEQRIKSSIAKFRADMELVYLGAVGTTKQSQLDFSTSSCYGSIDGVGIFKGTSALCSRQVGVKDCLIIAVTAPNNNVPFVEAINIPASSTTVNYDDSSTPIAIDCVPSLASLENPATWNCDLWKATYHTFIIKKTSSNTITIIK